MLPGLTAETEEIIRSATAEAKRLRHTCVCTEHFLLAFAQSDNEVREVLAWLSPTLTYEEIRKKVEKSVPPTEGKRRRRFTPSLSTHAHDMLERGRNQAKQSGCGCTPLLLLGYIWRDSGCLAMKIMREMVPLESTKLSVLGVEIGRRLENLEVAGIISE